MLVDEEMFKGFAMIQLRAKKTLMPAHGFEYWLLDIIRIDIGEGKKTRRRDHKAAKVIKPAVYNSTSFIAARLTGFRCWVVMVAGARRTRAFKEYLDIGGSSGPTILNVNDEPNNRRRESAKSAYGGCTPQRPNSVPAYRHALNDPASQHLASAESRAYLLLKTFSTSGVLSSPESWRWR